MRNVRSTLVGVILEADPDGLRARMAGVPESELRVILSLACGSYPTPSMLYARDELKRRGLPYPDLPATPSVSKASDGPEKARQENPFAHSSLLTKVLFSSATLGVLALKLFGRGNPRFGQLLLLCFAMWAAAVWSALRDGRAHGGLTPQDTAPARMASDAGEEERSAYRMPRWWYWVCLASGMGIMILTLRNSAWNHGKPSIYGMTLGMDLFALSDWNSYLAWDSQTSRFKTHQVLFAVIACFLTLWSILCLVGIVNYQK